MIRDLGLHFHLYRLEHRVIDPHINCSNLYEYALYESETVFLRSNLNELANTTFFLNLT